VFDEDQLREMSHPERHELMRRLAAIENADPAAHDPSPRRRAFVLTLIVVCCVVLAAWIGVLAVTLPGDYRAGGWRGAWVGFDVALLAAFAVTGWAAWRRRQVLIICLVVLATLLCCDAWFDVSLDARTSGFALSVLSAVFVELPLATLAIIGARRLLRLSLAVIRRYEGQTGEPPSLRQAKLVGSGTGTTLGDLFMEGDARPEGRGGPGSEPWGGLRPEGRGGLRPEGRGGPRSRAADHGDRAGSPLGAASDHGDSAAEDETPAGLDSEAADAGTGRPGYGSSGHRSADPGLYRAHLEADRPARAADDAG
jgi:hypothetical protein